MLQRFCVGADLGLVEKRQSPQIAHRTDLRWIEAEGTKEIAIVGNALRNVVQQRAQALDAQSLDLGGIPPLRGFHFTAHGNAVVPFQSLMDRKQAAGDQGCVRGPHGDSTCSESPVAAPYAVVLDARHAKRLGIEEIAPVEHDGLLERVSQVFEVRALELFPLGHDQQCVCAL